MQNTDTYGWPESVEGVASAFSSSIMSKYTCRLLYAVFTTVHTWRVSPLSKNSFSKHSPVIRIYFSPIGEVTLAGAQRHV
jgi:hypothetical protein